MPVVTPFGDLTLGDPVSEARWLDAHDRRHRVYVREGVGGKGGSLEGPIGGDWMLRHANRHTTIAKTTKDPDFGSAEVKALALPAKWKTEAELQDWHLLHNRLHFHTDKVADISEGRRATHK